MKKKYFISKKVKSHKAIAMIELIFAIVIIGITLLSIPNLVYKASESGYTTIQQESIAAAASDLSLILSREWDEVGTSDEFHTPILETTDGASSLSRSARPKEGRSRSFFTGIGGPYSASSIANDGDFDDIDDAHAQTAELHLIDGTKDLIDVNISIYSTVDYVVDTSDTGDDWNSTSDLVFSSPFAATASLTNSSNIKRISLTLTSNSPIEELADKEIVFTAFSCNIGSYKLERREF